MGKSNNYFQHQSVKQIAKIMQSICYQHQKWQVFSDWVEMMALALSNVVDFTQAAAREERYLEIVKRYSKDELNKFCEMFALLVDSMDMAAEGGGMYDHLGELYHGLDLHNKWHGQFFTPMNICNMMGAMTLGEGQDIGLKERGYITLCEPCVGGGAMVIGFANAMKRQKLNYCKQMVATCVDIDLKCVHMAYVQLSLYGIPAVVIHGNSILVEEWSRWNTFVYVADG